MFISCADSVVWFAVFISCADSVVCFAVFISCADSVVCVLLGVSEPGISEVMQGGGVRV